MPSFSYRYRPVHAICERLLEIVTPLIPASKGNLLNVCPPKILVLKFGGMGEAILARSLVDHLRQRNPSVKFDFLVESRTIETMICGSSSDAMLYQPKGHGLRHAFKTLKEIRKRKYNAIIDFEQASILTATFARLTSIPIRIGFIPSGVSSREKFFTHPIRLQENESMWEAFIKLGRLVDIELPEVLTTIPLPYSPEVRSSIENWWHNEFSNSIESPVVAFHLGVGPSAQYRQWPLDRFLELGLNLFSKRNDLTVVLTGGSSERPLIKEFIARFPGKVLDASLFGSVEHSAALLHRCDLLISGDTGIMHLGAAMGTPTVGLFGPNTPKCWAPVGPRATYVYATKLSCSPCINSYRRFIPEECIALEKGACMSDIKVTDVLRAAKLVVHTPWI